jgi:hypothetical protein
MTSVSRPAAPPVADRQPRRRLAPGLPGALALALSLLACYGTLAAVTALSALGVTLALHEGLWAGTIVLFALLALAAVVAGRERHGRLAPSLSALAGTLLLGYVMFVEFTRVLELVAFALLALAVVWDARLGRRPAGAGTAASDVNS